MYQVTDNLAMIQTLDFFTPITEDAQLFGRIAATNALSDVYAMGGTPVTAMNIVCFPGDGDFDVLHLILKGALDVCNEAGCVLAGGHTVDDKSIKFGLSVTGLVHPRKIWRNSTVKEGDLLVITKPIGTGIVVTAELAGMARKEHIDLAWKVMTTLNKVAAETAKECTIHSATDVTGFGLGGHLIEMARASNITITVDSAQIPVLDGALEYASFGLVPSGAWKNQTAYDNSITVDSHVTDEMINVIFDPQTSGGLLFSVDANDAEYLVKALNRNSEIESRIIGKATSFRNRHLFFR